MFNSCDFRRSVQAAIAGLAILAMASIPAAGQRGGGGGGSGSGSGSGGGGGRHGGSDQQAELNGEMYKGIEAYKSGLYDEAIRHFQKATAMAPNMPQPKMYLGTAQAQKVVPGRDTPENLKNAQQAIDTFMGVLDMLPHNVKSMKQIAAIEISINKLEDAKTWQKKVLVEDAKDAEAAYAVGVIDWTEAQQNAQAALKQAGMKDDGEGNAKAPASVMDVIKAHNGALVAEALQYLNQAVENRPDYDKAMSFLDLAYRRKADLDWGNDAARKDDVAKADEWGRKAKETHKANEDKKKAEAQPAKP
jgi:tetratricopeptide (TPR) repeat protein